MRTLQAGLRILVAATVVTSCSVFAADLATSSSSVIVPQEPSVATLQSDLAGVPDTLKTLVLNFEQLREQYLQKQNLLLIALKNAATPQEREQLRQELQANRRAFLLDSRGFLEELRSDLQSLKGKISHAEFGRIIDAAHSTAASHRHRGQ